MYLDFFALHERPFSITPDPRYLFMSERHAEALAHLIYGVTESDGFIVLTGEVGTGKTTLVRSLLQKMPAEADVALVLNPQLTAAEFLTAINKELGIALPEDTGSCRALTEDLNQYLLDAHSRGRRTIAVVDEAQNLSAEVLEQIRLLTNLETTRHKLLQIVLIGQPELRELLARTDLRQLAQRVTARYHLLPLNMNEASQYLDHRLAVAGAVQPILTPKAKHRIHQLAGGIPRLMNLIADRALLGAWSREQRSVDKRLVNAAAGEVFGGKSNEEQRRNRWPQLALALTCMLLVALSAVAYFASRAPTTSNTTTALVTKPLPTVEQSQPVSEPPVAEPLAQPLPSLSDWLAQHRDRTGNVDAFATLFAAWGLSLDREIPSACEQAREFGLRCAADRSALSGLLLLDRPAIMTLIDENAEAHQIVLSGYRDGEMLLQVPDGEVRVPRGELEPLWFGEYLLLWKPPNDRVQNFVPGMRDPGIVWLRQSLTAIMGRDIQPADSTLYDDTLETQVRDYQRSRRLTVDGLVGQQTQMMINTDLGLASIPRLSNTPLLAVSTKTAGSP